MVKIIPQVPGLNRSESRNLARAGLASNEPAAQKVFKRLEEYKWQRLKGETC